MTHLEIELNQLREEIINMFNLVYSQLAKGLSALLNFDKDLAREIVIVEKRVNAAELKIDRDCENVLAIYSPVAVDLRFILAMLKINTNLERTGDIAEGIAKLILDTENAFKQELLESTKVIEMYQEALQILEEMLNAIEKDDSTLARSIFRRDELLDEINKKANLLVIDYLKKHPEDLHQALNLLSIIRRLERVGDQVENIAEEVIFYLEAKVIKHSKKWESNS
jgi:phosphate transport system protein